jgi:urea carboxylase
MRRLVDALIRAEDRLPPVDDMVLTTRIVRMPLAFEDNSCRDAIGRYMQSVRKTAPWLPSNVEFIRRINGLGSVDEVRDIVFKARYMVLGLGDVYLGAPCAVPIDPRHRLLTSKYNPARTYTPEGAVGIGGVYMCIYGMDSPGGYQLIGRTVPIWNKFLKNADFAPGEPWLLRFFDQVQFYPVSEAELAEQRLAYAAGQARLDIAEERFVLRDYHAFLASIADECAAFKARQTEAFYEERARWEVEVDAEASAATEAPPAAELGGADGVKESVPDGAKPVYSHIAGNVWELAVKIGDRVRHGDKLFVIESMKMEFTITSPSDGEIVHIACARGRTVTAGQRLLSIQS